MNFQRHIIRAVRDARLEAGIKDGEKAIFGDCGDVSRRILRIIKACYLYKCDLKHGTFVCGPDDNSEDEDAVIEFDHTWLEVDGHIVDGTVDQFFSDLDEDMVTATDGLYFSHPEQDGDSLKDRYRSRDYAKPPANPER